MDLKSMTIDEAANAIFEEAKRQGVPLTMDVCEQIAKRLLVPRHISLAPGEVAQRYRDRYVEE
jgi:hypothetical protein